jgi:NADPH-dependent glutamate synthase beta subunit-like oxidoreductase
MGTSEGNLDDAWWALKLENPFPGVCGRVCHHPCEASCNRNELEGATSIHGIERYLADHFSGKQVKPPILREKQGKKTAVVGSGPAGLACAYFLSLLGYDVTVFEARNELGGIPQIAIPSYRLPEEVLNKEIQDILSLGMEVRTECRVGKDVEFSKLLEFDAVFLATGAHREMLLDVPGEKSEGVYGGLDFLNRIHLKESIDLGEKTLVVGGGNVAIDVAMTSLRLGAKEVSIVCLERRDEMPAWEHEIEEALEEGIRIINGLGPRRISHENGHLTGIEFKRCISVFDQRGSFNPQYDEKDITTMEADTVVVAIGQRADLSFVEKQGISVTREGVLKADPVTLETSIQGIFAGGDIIDQPWTVSHAIGSAKRAAIAMDHYLRGNDLRALAEKGSIAQTIREHLGLHEKAGSSDGKVATLQDLNLAYCHPSPMGAPDKLTPADRMGTFKEMNMGMRPEQAGREARRCLSCGLCRMCGNCYLFCPDGAVQLDSEAGRYVIDYEYCKGCGVCQNECPTGVIILESEGEG